MEKPLRVKKSKEKERRLSPPPAAPKLTDFAPRVSSRLSPQAECPDSKTTPNEETRMGAEESEKAPISSHNDAGRNDNAEESAPNRNGETANPPEILTQPISHDEAMARLLSAVPQDGRVTQSEAKPREKPKVAPRSIYPTELIHERQSLDAPLKINTPKVNGEVSQTVYSRIRGDLMLEVNEHGLLSEAALCSFYPNDRYEMIDDFVDNFARANLESRYCLWLLLQRYNEACDNLEHIVDSKAETERNIARVFNECWSVEDRTVTQTGRCGDSRSASGTGTYKVATHRPEKVVALNQLMSEHCNKEVDENLCWQIHSRSLALQIQWKVVNLGRALLDEHKVPETNPPSILVSDHVLDSRRNIRGALSDLFYHLRVHHITQKFRDCVTGWIVELASYLMKCATSDDQLFLLCQVLHTPSPVHSWAPQLVQTYITHPALDMKSTIDDFVALLNVLMSPLSHRELFLDKIKKATTCDDNSWAIVGEDGETEIASFVTISEDDLIALLDQFNIQDLFKNAVIHFTVSNNQNAFNTILSLVALELLLLKIFNEGLKSYNNARYKSFCRQIGHSMHQSVKDICMYWNLCRPQFTSQQHEIVEKEIDRIVVLTAYYIISKDNVGLWLYLVDIPYDAVSEACRLRCELLLRHPTNYTASDLFAMSQSEVEQALATGSRLIEKISDANSDSTYMLSALAAVVSSSSKEPESFLRDIVHVCFLDESTREQYYKVGSTAVGILIERKPSLLSTLLKIIDRNADHLDNYAVDILTNCPLSNCRLNKDDVGSIFGKWLINRPVDHPVSRIARRVLTSVNWGPASQSGGLWIEQNVHEACAEAIVKGHIAQFKNQNGLISKSMQKAMKMWSKIPDAEQQFNNFCFDVLIRLKPSTSHSPRIPSADVTDYFLYLAQYCLSSANLFIDNGLTYFQQLISSGCFTAAATILTRFVARFPEATARLVQSDSFREAFDVLLHADTSSYAMQLLVGADNFPGPVVKCLSSAITYSMVTYERKSDVALGWLRLLCSKRSTDWNRDNTSLFLIGNLVDIMVSEETLKRSSAALNSAVDFISDIYKESLKMLRESPGFLSLFMTNNTPPPLIDKENFKSSPSASFVLLKAEHQSYSTFYEHFYNSLGKTPTHTVEHAAKKASSKSNIDLPPCRLYYSRLIDLCCTEEVSGSVIFTLLLQELATVMFSRKDFAGRKFCPGERYFGCKTTHWSLVHFRDVAFPAMKAKLPPNSEHLCRAVLQWIFTHNIYSMNFSKFDKVLDDYLLQLIFADNLNPWTNFLNEEDVKKKIATDRKLYANCCHLDIMPKSCLPQRDCRIISIDEYIRYLSKNGAQNESFPSVPQHPNLPIRDNYDEVTFSNTNFVLSRFGAKLVELQKAAAVFADAKGRITDLDVQYGSSIRQLYKQSQTTLRITLKCGDMFSQRTCTKPVEVEAIVSASHFSPAVDATMGANRQQRIVEISSTFGQLVDSIAVVCAHIESLVDSLSDLSLTTSLQLRRQALQKTGKTLFNHVCNTVTASSMLFLAATKTYEATISILGKEFMANVAEEQNTIMNVVLSGNVLSYIIVENFTPDNVPSPQLFSLYKQLSVAVRCPQKSQSAKSLLSRLDIVNAGRRLPAEQYSQLLPVIFENIASVGTQDENLLQLCMDHFLHTMFHKFPHNMSAGLKMMLGGCDTKNTPKVLFDMVMAQIGCGVGTTLSSSTNAKHRIPPEMVISYIDIIANQLKSSRRELSTRLYEVWAEYLEPVCRLAAYFIITHVENTFHYERPPSAMENDLRDCFNRCTLIWGQLLEPLGPDLPPFNPSDRSVAHQVVDRFMSLLLWLPYNKRLPQGSENLETLFFQYLCNRLACIKNTAAAHVYSVYVVEFVKLNWQTFWPTLLDIGQLEKILSDSDFSEIHPFLSEIFVRIPWNELQRLQTHQPHDALTGFYSLLFSILTRVVAREANYVRCRASMPRLLKSLINSPWYLVTQPFADKSASFIAQHFNPESFFTPNEITTPFFSIWALVSWSSTDPALALTKVSPVEKVQKQSLFIKTRLHLLHRSGFELPEMMKNYKSVIEDVNAIVMNYPDDFVETACLSQTLAYPWTLQQTEKAVEEYQKVYAKWLQAHPESKLVLLAMMTTLPSLGGKFVFTSLKLVDAAINTYFTRNTGTSWSVVQTYLELTKASEHWLFTTPSTESGVVPLFLALNGLLMKELSACGDRNQEWTILKKLSAYITTVKPKYVVHDAALLTVIEKWLTMLIRQYCIGIPVAKANEQVTVLTTWLHRVYSEEKSSGILSRLARIGRSAPFSAKMQIIAEVLELFISQQTTAPGRLPRLADNVPVTNSKIEAFKALSQSKAYSEALGGESGSDRILPYFTDVDKHHLGNVTDLFKALVKPMYPDEKVLHYLW